MTAAADCGETNDYVRMNNPSGTADTRTVFIV